MKRIICLILALLLLVPAAYADESSDMVFHMESVTGKVGDTVTVMASVKNAPKCASFRIIFTYDDTVLEVVSGKKEKAKGLFMINTDTEHDGKAAVNALAADASKALEGDMDLFSVKFKIIAETEGNAGTLLEVVTEEFFKEDLSQIHPTIEQARVYVGSDVPGGTEDDGTNNEGTGNEGTNNEGTTNEGTNNEGSTNEGTNTEGNTPSTTPDNTTGDNDTNGETNTTTPDNTTGDKQDDTPASTTPETDKTEDKTPTGSWVVDEEKDEVVHVQENGDYTTYVPEFVETPEVGKTTDVILKDEETGKEVGSIKVEKQEDGTIEVVEQDLSGSAKKSGVPGWVWTVIGVVVVAAAAAVILVVVKRKKKEDEPAEGSTDEE